MKKPIDEYIVYEYEGYAERGRSIVRCKDCKYFIVSPDFSCCKLTEAIVGEDDFCSKGAR